jgi:hypothetical protein
MSIQRYKVLLPLNVGTEDREGIPGGTYTQDEEFDYAATEEEEAAWLQSGLLEILPQEYKVIGGSNVHGADPGEHFTKALRIGEERLLIEGGHIERVKQPAPKKRQKKEE